MTDVNANAKEKLKFYGKTVLTIILIIIIAWIALKLYHEFKRPPNADYLKDEPPPGHWAPTKVTDLLFDVINGVFDFTNDKDAAYLQFNNLTDNQKIAVYNDWNDRYSTETNWGVMYGSLTEAIDDEVGYSMFGGVNNMDKAKENLKRLKLP